MSKKSIFTKAAALIMATMLGISAIGCSAKDQPIDGGGIQTETETQTNTIEDATDVPSSSGTGRYVEQTVYEGEFWDKVSAQTLSDGPIMFVNSLTSQQLVSEDGGNTWNAESSDAFAAFRENHYPVSTAISKDGILAIISMDKKDAPAAGENTEYIYNLYIYNTDHTSKQIPIDLPDADSRVSEAAFDENGTLYVYASGCRWICKVDINTGTAEKITELPESCYLMECRDNILMCLTFEKIFLYDLEKKIFIEDETLDSFTKENYDGMSWTGGGFTVYAFLGGDHSVYVAGESGLYRHVIGGSMMEQVIDGALSSLGTPSHDILAMIVNDQSEFLTVYNDGSIVKFVYDAAVSAIPDEKLTVYSLNDDETVRQAIAVYQTQYPNIYINYQIGLGEGGVTREDALKKLNTQLLSGNGPDVIMLDDIDIETYSEKGVLMDLSELVSEADKSDGLYINLIKSMQSDHAVYAIPAQFCIPVIGGQRDMVDSINDYSSLAKAVETAREEYPDKDIMYLYSAKEVMKRFIAVNAPAWKDDEGKLDTRRIKEFLEQSKKIYDIQINGTPAQIIASHQQSAADIERTESNSYSKYRRGIQSDNYLTNQSPFVHGEITSSHTYRETVSIPRIEGFEDAVFKPLNGQSSNVYCPLSIMGVNAASKNSDAAKQFVRVMLSEPVLEVLEFGLPVNKKALAEKFAYDESRLDENGGQYSMSAIDANGVLIGITYYPVEQDGIAILEQWIAGLDTPYLSDTVLENAVCTEGTAYIEGRQELDATVQAIADSVGIYLYE